jgi:arabinofuranosyltransferase
LGTGAFLSLNKPPNLPNLISHTLIATGLLLFAGHTYLFWPFTVDDAFITFRYAENLALHAHPAFNLTGTPADGNTSVLWMLLLSVVHLMKMDPVVAAKILGTLSTLATFALLYLFCSRWLEGRETSPDRTKLITAFTVFVATGYYAFAVHAVAGLETPLTTFCVLLFSWTLVSDSGKSNRQRFRRMSIAALALGLVRPEGNLFALVGLGVLFFQSSASDKKEMARNVFVFYFLPGLAYLGWRFAYYGTVFPLSFYAKTASADFFAGRFFVKDFLMIHGAVFGVLIVAGLVDGKKAHLPILMATAALILFYCNPDPIMCYTWRYLMPLVPILFLLVARGFALLIEGLWPRSENSSARGMKKTAVMILLIAPLMFLAENQGRERDAREKMNYAQGFSRAHYQLGRFLGEMDTGEKQPKMAIGDAGAVPYYSKWFAIDTFSLNDPTLVRSPLANPNYLFSNDLDLLVLLSNRPDRFESESPKEKVYWQYAAKIGMKKVNIVSAEKNYHLWLMADPASPIGKQIAKADFGEPIVAN